MKTFLKLFLVWALLHQQMLFAASLPSPPPLLGEGFFDSIEVINTAKGGFQTYTDSNGHTAATLGGAYSIKRAPFNYELFWHIEPPSIDASCSGVDFKGMFGVVIDTEQMKEQFSEAGESLAWGILIGIIYSLPGIGEIFQKINDWAKKIQALLANACGMGVAIGKGIGNGVARAAKGPEDNTKTKEDWSDNILPSYEDSLGKVFDCSSDIYTSTGSSADCADLTNMTSNIIGGAWFGEPSILTNFLLSYYRENTKEWINGTIPTGVSLIDWSSDLSSDATLLKDLSFYMLITNATGEVYMPQDTYNVAKAALDTASDSTKNEKEKASAFKNAFKKFKSLRGVALLSAPTIKMSVMTDYLLYGWGDNNGTNRFDFRDALILPSIAVYQQSSQGSNGSADATLSAAVVSGDATSFGAIGNAITSHIEDYKGIKTVAENTADCLLGDSNASSCLGLNSQLVSSEKAKYFAKIYRNSPSDIRIELKKDYIEVSTYFMGKAVIQKVSAAASHLKMPKMTLVTTNVTTSSAPVEISTVEKDDSAKEVAVVNLIEKLSKSLAIELETWFDGKNIKNIIKRFEDQDKRNLKKAFGTNG